MYSTVMLVRFELNYTFCLHTLEKTLKYLIFMKIRAVEEELFRALERTHTQWRTQEFCSGGGSTNSVEDRGQRENGDLGAVTP